jgi:hypothetical protein
LIPSMHARSHALTVTGCTPTLVPTQHRAYNTAYYRTRKNTCLLTRNQLCTFAHTLVHTPPNAHTRMQLHLRTRALLYLLPHGRTQARTHARTHARLRARRTHARTLARGSSARSLIHARKHTRMHTRLRASSFHLRMQTLTHARSHARTQARTKRGHHPPSPFAVRTPRAPTDSPRIGRPRSGSAPSRHPVIPLRPVDQLDPAASWSGVRWPVERAFRLHTVHRTREQTHPHGYPPRASTRGRGRNGSCRLKLCVLLPPLRAQRAGLQ